MESLQQKVVERLREHLDEDLADGLETVPGSGRVTGWISTAAFEGKDHSARQELLWGIVDRELEEEERAKVGPIVTLTPTEAKFDVTMDL